MPGKRRGFCPCGRKEAGTPCVQGMFAVKVIPAGSELALKR